MEKTVNVTNRSNGSVVYRIPELNLRREFFPKETKIIETSEIDALVSQPGGRELIYDYLIVSDKEVLRTTLNVKEEPEYWLTEENIPRWMITCPLDEFKDALDFAPDGVKDLIIKFAVDMPLNDVSKREAIKTQLKFDVTKTLENLKAEATADGDTAPAASGNRRRTTTTSIPAPAKKEVTE